MRGSDNGFPSHYGFCAKEFANENRNFHLHSSALSFHNVARSSIHDFFSLLSLAALQPVSNSVDAQREAMRKLSFLAGHWSGPVTIVHGPGEALHLTQTEAVEYQLDGLVLLIEGKSTSADGKVLFSALATIAYDDASHTYRFRAYNDGHYLDTELSVPANGFSWSFMAGLTHIVNTMHLTGKGEWDEVTEATVGSNPPHRSVDMQLQHQP